MYLKSRQGVYGYTYWDDYADNYETSVHNKCNMICVFEGIEKCIALISKRAKVLATRGLPVKEMQFLIDNGYIKQALTK